MKPIRRFVSSVFACACIAVAGMHAQANKIAFTEYDLPNGMHVILHQDKSAPVVATVVHYRVGSRDENPERTGFAHFFEHLMFEGTKDIPRKSMDKYIESAGGYLNAYTSFDQTVYIMRMPSNQLQLALWIEFQRMRGLIIDEVGVETQRQVVKEERRVRYENQPYGSLLEKLAQNVFKGGSYSWTAIGSAQHIDVASIDEFRTFYDNFYQPNNATLVIAGDFDEKQARAWVQAYFGSLPKGPEPKREKFTLDDLNGEIRERVDDPKAQVPLMVAVYRGPADGNDDYYPLSLLLNILGAGESSRLYRRLVDQEQVAVTAAPGLLALQNAGVIYMQIVSAPGKELTIGEKMFYEEVEKVIAEGVTEEELRKAKNIKESEFVNEKKGVQNKADALARYYSFFKNTNLINTEIAKYMAVTRADIQRVARKYFGTNNRVILEYYPAAQK